MATTIPRFLLPQQSSIWRTRIVSSSKAVQIVRNASHKAPLKSKAAPKVPVLEKPAKFNPPSHGARLRKDPPRYPGPALSAAQKAAQQTKKYPNMMPVEGTFMHWFLNNRSIHIYITLVLAHDPFAIPYGHFSNDFPGYTVLLSRLCNSHKFQADLQIRRHATGSVRPFLPPNKFRACLH